MKALIDVDDLWHAGQIEQFLEPLRNVGGAGFRMTAYAIPNRLGPVHQLKEQFPWLTFAIHGFEHALCECRAWTSDDGERLIGRALEMGYAPVFKPPNWVCDTETEEACKTMGVILHHHEDYDPTVPGLKTFPGPIVQRPPIDYRHLHTHIQKNPSTDFILEHPGFRPANMVNFDTFLTLEDVAVEVGGD